MNEICVKCGLPKELCVCQEISKEKTRIKITIEQKKFKKIATIIEGFDQNVDLKMIAKELKQKLACGGTAKDKRIELQGEHRARVKQILLKMNYAEDQIDMV